MAENLAIRLAKLDTCAVSDALDRLGLKGATIGIRPVWPCPRIAGRAVTIRIASAGAEPPKQHLGTAAIEAAARGDIIVVDNRGRVDVSSWGGLLSLAAKLKGLSGVVVDGACRDVDDIREVALPVYARGVVPMTARGRVVQRSLQEEIQCGDATVRPRDLVIADGSGVVFIPRERENEVIEAAEAIFARESLMAEALRQGRSVVEVMEGIEYESMVARGKPG